jgi:hypothetical protein
MKSLTTQQIEQVKSLRAFSTTRFHGNKKVVGLLPIDLYVKVVIKKYDRAVLRQDNRKETPTQIVKRLYLQHNLYKGTPYAKILIEGNTGIYLASPSYGHNDYNKCRVFDKNEQTIKLMHLYNSLINK